MAVKRFLRGKPHDRSRRPGAGMASARVSGRGAIRRACVSKCSSSPNIRTRPCFFFLVQKIGTNCYTSKEIERGSCFFRFESKYCKPVRVCQQLYQPCRHRTRFAGAQACQWKSLGGEGETERTHWRILSDDRFTAPYSALFMPAIHGANIRGARRAKLCFPVLSFRLGPHSGTDAICHLLRQAGRLDGQPAVGSAGCGILARFDEGLDHLEGLVVGELAWRVFAEIGRGRFEHAAQAAVQGQLGAADGVDGHAGRVG